MGDVGSIFLGILIGTFSLITENDGSLSLVDFVSGEFRFSLFASAWFGYCQTDTGKLNP